MQPRPIRGTPHFRVESLEFAPAGTLNLIGKGCGGRVSRLRKKRSRAFERIPYHLFHLRLRMSHETAARMIQLTREDAGNFARFFP